MCSWSMKKDLILEIQPARFCIETTLCALRIKKKKPISQARPKLVSTRI